MTPRSQTLAPSAKIGLNSGRSMPVMGLGTWELTRQTADTVAYALELGFRMIDTACDYGSQPGIGEALRETGMRDSIYLVAKVEENDDALEATRRYLDDIGVESADLMLIHRPPPGGVGEALWNGLAEARERGWTRDIGVSNYTVAQIEELATATGEWPVVNQIEWSPFGFSQRMLEFCRDRDIVLQAYSPLTRAERLNDRRLVEIADRYEKTPAQLLIRWNLDRGTVPLPKANRRDHLREDIDVFDFTIETEDHQRLAALNDRYSALGSLPYE